MTIRQKLSMGIGILMTLFLALGVISYFQIGQIDDNLTEIIRSKALGKRAVVLNQQYKDLDAELENAKDARKQVPISLLHFFLFRLDSSFH